MNRKESDALCREITGLHSEGRWLEANERLWQTIEAVQGTEVEIRALRALKSRPIYDAEQAVLRAVREYRGAGLPAITPHEVSLWNIMQLDEALEAAAKEVSP